MTIRCLRLTGWFVPAGLLLLSLCSWGGFADEAAGRIRQRFDDGWRFRRDADPALAAGNPFRWTWRPATVASIDIPTLPADLDAGDWQAAAPGQDVFRGRRGFVWYRSADLGADPKGADRILHFETVDDNAAVYLNGTRLVRHSGWNEPFDVPVRAAWKPAGPNVFVVLVQNTDGPGGITGPVTFDVPAPETVPDVARADYDDSSWRGVHLPHDYVVEEPFDRRADTSHGSLTVVPAWYRKTFTLPASYRGKSVWLEFDGVYRKSTVWLNGVKLGEWPSGYIGFRYDIGRQAVFGGRNVLAVRVDPRQAEGWWYEGGGIYRHVWLNAADPLHAAPWGIVVRSTLREPVRRELPVADLSIRTLLVNDADRAAECELISRVVAPNGKTVATVRTSQSVPAGRSVEVEQAAAVPSTTLWSVESPRLYRLQTTVSRQGAGVDGVETSFGIRTIRFDVDKGFFLNGKPVKLKGTCNHQDHAGVGIALPDSLMEWRIRKLKEMGSNAYRCSHNPPAPELLDACDRLGMLVMDETRHLGDSTRGKAAPGTKATELAELRSMVLRDRNHPSIVIWSMCNEEGLQGTPEGGRIFAAMKAATRELDPTRPVTAAMNGGWEQGITLETDVEGINYAINRYDWFREKFPRIPVLASETASTVGTRGIYANDAARGYVSAYDLNRPPWGATAETAWKGVVERPFMAGAFVWTGFDYKGEPTPYGWPCINSHFGILDICGFPKDNFYYYQAWWGSDPIVHVFPHWNRKGKEGQPVSVWCHSNAERVDLLLNGTSLGSREMPRYGHLEWQVPYAPGTLVARGYRGDRLVATGQVETTGPPAAIRLKTDRLRLIADGEDVSLVEVQIVDAAGRVVPDADNLVLFSVTGPGEIAGVGNGDPSSHEPDRASQRQAFNGFCMALVRASDRPGRITLVAASAGLKNATLELRSARGPGEEGLR